MTKYDSGRRIEYKVQQWLEEKGYSTTRSAGSKGAFDVIAYNGLVVRFIQAKREISKTSYKAEFERMVTVPIPEGCTKELWVYTKGKGFTYVYIIQDTYHHIALPEQAWCGYPDW